MVHSCMMALQPPAQSVWGQWDHVKLTKYYNMVACPTMQHLVSLSVVPFSSTFDVSYPIVPCTSFLERETYNGSDSKFSVFLCRGRGIGGGGGRGCGGS